MTTVLRPAFAVLLGSTLGYSAYAVQRCNRLEKPMDAFALVEPLANRFLSPEQNHRLAVWALSMPKSVRFALGLIKHKECPLSLQTNVFGIKFENPVGLAAGFDKNAEAMEGAFDLGFGFVEIGSVTPIPQAGNAKPRVWKFPEIGAVVNCYGFNSEGHGEVERRLREYSGNVVGVNLGKNKESEGDQAIDDYGSGIARLGKYAQYVVVNISSPNTPGLRSYQKKEKLEIILKRTMEARDNVSKTLPLLIKISPDLSEEDKKDIADLILYSESSSGTKIDGLVVSNTTTQRPGAYIESLEAKHKFSGGLSGAPLFATSTKMVFDMYKLTEGRVPIIGVGGISTGKQAYAKIKAGASLVQLYSSLAIHGPYIVEDILSELSSLVEKDGFKNVQEAVGSDHKL